MKQYNVGLIDTIFGGILRFGTLDLVYNHAYNIGDLFIQKYYLKGNTKSKVDRQVPNLDKFINKYFYFGKYNKHIDCFPIKIEFMRKKIKVLKKNQVENGDEKPNIDWEKNITKAKDLFTAISGSIHKHFLLLIMIQMKPRI